MTAETDPIAERFARETAKHELTILHDDDLYRHLRFRNPKNSGYWFDLITVPGSLIFRGDGESFVFARVPDMFGFFRSNPDRLIARISPDYWAEKLTSSRDAVKTYSRELLERNVGEALSAAEKQWPGITAAWNEHAGEDNLDYGLDYEDGARQALADFKFGGSFKADCACGGAADFVGGDPDEVAHRGEMWLIRHRGPGHVAEVERVEPFRFEDTWEWNLQDFDWWYLWACHAIVWGIARYDEARKTAAAQSAPAEAPEAVAVSG